MSAASPHMLTCAKDDEYVPTPGGRSIGKYQNAAYYREGLFSVIYRAPALEDDSYFPPESSCKTRLVALKVTTPSVMEPPHDSQREATILRRTASTRVIPLLDTFRENGSHFILVFPFMRYDLGTFLREKGVSRAQGKSFLRDLFSGLNAIHARGVIHRDIKPANILLKSIHGPAYLSDFGVSWAPNVPGSEPSDQKTTDVGTTCYRPPELLFGNKQYGCSLDLWAAGCTVAEVLDPAHHTLFDPGELGSDLALIQSMFKKLGTPNLEVWPVCLTLLVRAFTALKDARKQPAFPTGAKCSSMSIPGKNGRRYSRISMMSAETWSQT